MFAARISILALYCFLFIRTIRAIESTRYGRQTVLGRVSTSTTTSSASVNNDDNQPPSSTIYVDAIVLTNALSEYYENIVDQVMASLTQDIVSSAPRTFTALHHTRSTTTDHHEQECSDQTPLDSFTRALHDHLNLMRTNLLSSIRPLVESNLLPPPSTTTTDRVGSSSKPVMISSISQLSDDNILLALNRHLGFQLGLIVNADEAADIIISQSLPPQSSTTTIDRKVMVEWLRSWLSSIDPILRIEFDQRVQDATQSILEDFLVDE